MLTATQTLAAASQTSSSKLLRRSVFAVFASVVALTCAGCLGTEQQTTDDTDTGSDAQTQSRWAGQNSGLSWKSGFANGDRDDEFNHLLSDQSKYLGRETDIYASFLPHDSLDDTQKRVDGAKKEFWTELSQANIRVLQVVPLLFSEDVKRVEQVIKPGPLHDKYVAFWKDMGKVLAASGAKAPVLRLGHEMNLGDGYPWSVSKDVSAKDFVALYRLAADAIRSTKPDAVRCWNPGKGTTSGKTDDFWPGDGYVDVVGVDWYDNGSHVPMIESDAIWKANYMKTDDSGPIGVGAWYAYAKAHGKPIAFPEWALTDHTFKEADRPAYIRNMHDFFAKAASEGNMAFESYYNAVDSHQLYPVTSYFNASSKTYKQIFQPKQ